MYFTVSSAGVFQNSLIFSRFLLEKKTRALKTKSAFNNTVIIARSSGLAPVSEPKVRFSRAIAFEIA